MRTLLFATVAAAALGAAIPASAQVVYADPGPGVGVQVGPLASAWARATAGTVMPMTVR